MTCAIFLSIILLTLAAITVAFFLFYDIEKDGDDDATKL